jgi:hypothetical protein
VAIKYVCIRHTLVVTVCGYKVRLFYAYLAATLCSIWVHKNAVFATFANTVMLCALGVIQKGSFKWVKIIVIPVTPQDAKHYGICDSGECCSFMGGT